MRQAWITLMDGTYGYMWADALPLIGRWVDIWVRQPDNSLVEVRGRVSKATW